MDKLKQTIEKLKQSNGKIVFVVLGVLSSIWFLLRVLPKPSRAAYPCMRAAAPLMSSFIIWLMGSGTIVFLSKYIARLLKTKQILRAALLLLPLISIAVISIINNSLPSYGASTPPPDPVHPANNPFGEPQGIIPGRVIWFHNADATNEESKNFTNGIGLVDWLDDVYYQAKNNDSLVIQQMMDSSLVHLTGVSDVAQAWDLVFKSFNKKSGEGSTGYQPGEKIFIKTNNQGFGFKENMNPDFTQRDESAYGNFYPHGMGTSPYTVISTINQLVREAGVKQEDIYVGDPHQNFNDIYYNLLRRAFPDIHIMGINIGEIVDCEAYGRTKAVPDENPVVFYSDKGTINGFPEDRLYKQIVDAKYMINIACLKSHRGAGVTFFAKNHFGSHTRETAMHLHPSIPENVGEYGNYRVLTDLMGHKDLGGKTVLFIIDGLWGSSPCELERPRKWDMAPFNGDWSSSVFMSLDPVAIASVGFDFVRTEYTNERWWNENFNKNEAYPNKFGAVDDYLHQAASEDYWPDGIVYDPENDGEKIASLGVHEHWNNPTDMQYSKNLNPKAAGIELIKLHDIVTLPEPSDIGTSYKDNPISESFKMYPVPASDNLTLSFDGRNQSNYYVSIYDLSGKQVFSRTFIKTKGDFREQIDISHIHVGVYNLVLKTESSQISKKLLINR